MKIVFIKILFCAEQYLISFFHWQENVNAWEENASIFKGMQLCFLIFLYVDILICMIHLLYY